MRTDDAIAIRFIFVAWTSLPLRRVYRTISFLLRHLSICKLYGMMEKETGIKLMSWYMMCRIKMHPGYMHISTGKKVMFGMPIIGIVKQARRGHPLPLKKNGSKWSLLFYSMMLPSFCLIHRWFIGLLLFSPEESAVVCTESVTAGDVVVDRTDPIVPPVADWVSGCVVTRLQKLNDMLNMARHTRLFISFHLIFLYS